MDGLSSHEVEYRINNNMINNEDIKNSRSIKSIILSNLLTLFNFIHVVLFYLCLLLFHDFFLIKTFNFLSFVLILLLIFSNNYITCFFEEIYDKIVLRIRKKGRIVNEKK